MCAPPAKAIRDQLKVTPLTVDVCTGTDVPDASIELPALIFPLLIALATSVRSALAMTTAPTPLNFGGPPSGIFRWLAVRFFSDEGNGFAKKKNRDFMFDAEVLFIQDCRLGQPVEAKSP